MMTSKISSMTASSRFIDADEIGRQFGISASHLNFIFVELGLLIKNENGWVATSRGLGFGAVNHAHSPTGLSEVLWPDVILENRFFRKTIEYLIDVFKQDCC